MEPRQITDLLDEYLDHGSEIPLSAILLQLKTGELTLLQLAEWLRPSLTDVDNVIRRKHAIELLANSLKEGVALSAVEISTLEDFLLAKLSDWQCLDAALDGLESLGTLYGGNREKIALGLFGVIPSNYSQPTRKAILLLCEKLNVSKLCGMGYALGDGVLALCDDERDPRNLLISFRLLQEVLACDECVSDHALEKYFDHITSYFPVDFRPPLNDPHGITRKGLRAGLRLTMAAPCLSHFMVPFLVLATKDAREGTHTKRLKDCLKTLGTCIDHYSPTYGRSILRDMYALATPDFWQRVLACAFRDVAKGLCPQWLNIVPVDLNYPDLVVATVTMHPSLYHFVWSVVEKELRPDMSQALTDLAERLYDAQYHQGGQGHAEQLLPLCNRTCGLAVKFLGDNANRLSILLQSAVDPQLIIREIIAAKMTGEELLSWIRRERDHLAADDVIRATASLLPESADLVTSTLHPITADVCAAFSEVMDDTVAAFLAANVDLDVLCGWDVCPEAMSAFASALVRHAPNVGQDLAQRISEQSLRNNPTIMSLLPALAPLLDTPSATFLETLLLVKGADVHKLAPLQSVVARMPVAAVQAVVAITTASCALQAICIRVLCETHIPPLQETVRNHQLLQMVLNHPLLGPCPLLAQRILHEQFSTAPLPSKIVLLCENADAHEFPMRETVLMALSAPEIEDCVSILRLLVRVGVAELRSDFDAIVPSLGKLTCLPHLPITRLAALQVLDAILNTVDLRYTSPHRKHMSACFKECANDPRRTIRTFAAAAYGRSLVR